MNYYQHLQQILKDDFAPYNMSCEIDKFNEQLYPYLVKYCDLNEDVIDSLKSTYKTLNHRQRVEDVIESVDAIFNDMRNDGIDLLSQKKVNDKLQELWLTSLKH
jgi:hypothetical protein